MNARTTRTMLRMAGIGWYVAVCIGGGAFGGYLLDRWLALSFPILTLLGLGLGIAVAVLGMYRMLMAVLLDTSDSGNKGAGQ